MKPLKPNWYSPYFLLSLVSMPLAADPAGISDAGILTTLRASLSEHISTTETVAKTFEQGKEAVDISKKLAEWEGLKHVKELAGVGSDMRRLIANLHEGKEGFFRLINYPYKQVNELREDLETLQEQAKAAGKNPDLLEKIDRYSAVVSRMDNLAIVEDALMEAKKNRLLKGQSEGEAVRESSHNLAIMAELLVGQEKDRMAREAETLSARERAKQMSLSKGAAFGMYGENR